MKCLFSFTLLITVGGVLSDCVWNVNKDIAEKDPVFIKKSRRKYDLFSPSMNNIELKANQVLIATCPGHNNAVVSTNKPSVKLYCQSGLMVKVDGEIKSIRNISCVKNIAADVLPANKSDGSYNILNIGFHTDHGWIGLYNVSYDFQRSTPIYARHIIHGSSLKGTYTGNSSRPSFKSNGIPSNILWSKIFTKNYQKEIFKNLVGSSKTESIMSVTSLSKGHLAPDADFHFHSWELATYFYANVVPQWQSINAGNWLRIEKAVRIKAKELKEDLTIITGTEGVASIRNEDTVHPIYLSRNNQVPVPEYIWKIVCTYDNKCIAFVIFNNPFEGSTKTACNNLCSRDYDPVNWYLSSYGDTKNGVVVCCDVRELGNNFQSIPQIEVNGLLRY